MNADYSILPPHMRGGMRLYIEQGIEPGSFLSAVLSNDLMDAMRRADDINLYALPDYGRFLVGHAPSGCFGSPDRFRNWCAHGGLRGLEARQ